MFKRIAAALIGVCIMAAVPAHAQTAATPSPKALELAHKLVAKTNAANLMQQLIPTVIEPVVQKLKIANPGREADVQALVDKRLLPDFNTAMAPFFDAVAVTYAEHFTEAELGQILAFYDTPAGAKLVTEMPALLQQTMVKSKTMLPPVLGKVMNDFAAACKGEGLTVPQG